MYLPTPPSWPAHLLTVVFFIHVLGGDCLSLEHNGLDTTLIACGLFQSTKVNRLWSLGVRVGCTCSS